MNPEISRIRSVFSVVKFRLYFLRKVLDDDRFCGNSANNAARISLKRESNCEFGVREKDTKGKRSRDSFISVVVPSTRRQKQSGRMHVQWTTIIW